MQNLLVRKRRALNFAPKTNSINTILLTEAFYLAIQKVFQNHTFMTFHEICTSNHMMKREMYPEFYEANDMITITFHSSL